MSININVTQFQLTGTAVAVNALNDFGGIDSLMTHINNIHAANDMVKFTIWMDCLSQTLSYQGRYQGKCESRLKKKIFTFAKHHPDNALDVIDESQFKYDSKLKDTIDRVNYLSSSYFVKVIHHLKDSYGNNKRYGVSYFTTGSSLILLGGALNIVATSSISSTGNSTSPNEEKAHAAWGAVALGISMVAFPLVNSFYLAFRDEP